MNNQKTYPLNRFIKAFGYFVMFLFVKYYGIKKKIPIEVMKLNPPYLVLCNHIGFWDPPIIGYFLPKYVHFVSSDAVFRNPFIRFLLKGLGTIPKKKNIRDSKVIRDIAAVVGSGRSVGIFPEAVRNWVGKTQPIDISIAKLIKMLNVPVVAPILKGMNLFNPRWSPHLRRTKVVAEYRLLFTSEEVSNKTIGEIYQGLVEALHYDEVDNQRKELNPIKSKRKAEYINHTLYLCPECHSIDSFETDMNTFRCKHCNYDIQINPFGFFERMTAGKLHDDNIRDWFYWEEERFQQMIIDHYDKGFKGVIFEDQASNIYKGDEKLNMIFFDTADIKLYIDKISFEYHHHEAFTLNFDDLQTINPQVNEKLEIYYAGKAYRVIGGRPGVSALKWEVAVNVIWKKLGQSHKLSPYINLI
jgi:1-acyl-sn-glycerol-3-phosphate acyltransferase